MYVYLCTDWTVKEIFTSRRYFLCFMLITNITRTNLHFELESWIKNSPVMRMLVCYPPNFLFIVIMITQESFRVYQLLNCTCIWEKIWTIINNLKYKQFYDWIIFFVKGSLYHYDAINLFKVRVFDCAYLNFVLKIWMYVQILDSGWRKPNVEYLMWIK